MISEEETHKQQVERREQTKREEEAKLKNRLLRQKNRTETGKDKWILRILNIILKNGQFYGCLLCWSARPETGQDLGAPFT
jgi:hypothetical protein